MGKGRRPTPTALKLVTGNPGKRPLPKDEPKPKAGLPPCPAFLDARGRRAWNTIGKQLDAMGVVTNADQGALALLCAAYSDWMEACDLVELHGAVYEAPTQHGTILRKNPACEIRSDAHRRIVQLMTEFGLTPAARSKVSAAKPEEVDPFESLLSGAAKA